jgi:anti-sigma regulatory factor (Ser/Thr protein kinase)
MSERGEFHHEAFFYADPDGFLAGTVPFVREGLEAGEAVLAVLPQRNRELLRGELGADAHQAGFAAMEELGRNPGRLISAWHDFLAADRGRGRGVRGIGEPLWADRSAAEVEECRRHEALLNVAFADGPAWPLLCPYDAGRLDDEVLLAAEHSHPALSGQRQRSDAFSDHAGLEEAFGGSLERPRGEFVETFFGYDAEGLHAVRRLVLAEAARAGLEPGRAGDLVLAASEIAANSVRHGGGTGMLQIWRREGTVVCEFRDAGRIADPLVGRRRPGVQQLAGRGLWLANQLCDLVQIRWDGENVVRLQMSGA